MNEGESMLIKNLTTQIETMNGNHREDNDRLHLRLDEYNDCNQKNTVLLTSHSGKIKSLEVDVGEMKPKIEKSQIERKGRDFALKILKGVMWFIMAAGSIYGAWMKYKVG